VARTSAAGRLLDRLDELLRAGIPERTALDAELRRVIQAHEVRLARLGRANAERQARVRDGIHRAADRHLTAAFRKFTPRREWTGALWRYLERRHAHFGLMRRPCKRTIREALNEWIPPTGGAETLGYAAGDNSGGDDVRETDEHHEGQRRRRGEGAARAPGR
jgi:hypothetical protein